MDTELQFYKMKCILEVDFCSGVYNIMKVFSIIELFT